MIASVYHEDSIDDRRLWVGTGQGFAAFISQDLRAADHHSTHVVSNILVVVKGDSAPPSHISSPTCRITMARPDTIPLVAGTSITWDVATAGGGSSLGCGAGLGPSQ